jgi:tetratricopeptide (TPR) repeat protein
MSYFLKGLETYKEPDNIIIFNIIDFFFKYKQLDKAKKFIDIGLSMNPNNANMLNYLAKYHLDLSEYQLAKKYYEKAIQIDEKSLDALLGLSLIELDVLEDTDRALKILEKGFKYYPKNITMINNYAYCLILRGELSKASMMIDGVDFHNSVHLNATYGLLLIKQGNLEEGRKYYNKAAQIAKNNKELRSLVLQKKELELSLHYLEHDDIKEALKRLKKGLTYESIEKRYYDKLKKISKEIS